MQEAPFEVRRRRLLEPARLVPSGGILEVAGVLNPAFIALDGRSILVARVDEIISHDEAHAQARRHLCDAVIPYFDIQEAKLHAIPVRYPENYDPDHDRLFVPDTVDGAEGLNARGLYLSYISHLRLIEIAQDGSYMSDRVLVSPATAYDQFGCEDPRVVLVDRRLILTYNGLGAYGSVIHGVRLDETLCALPPKILLSADQKHGCLFPERVNQQFYLAARPLVRTQIKADGIWLHVSADSEFWKVLGPIVLPRSDMWDSTRVGPGAPPILTHHGWLLFYYGVDADKSYHVGAVLLDQENPARVKARTSHPIFSPSLEWELNGRRADSVFPSGANYKLREDRIELYYGAADSCIGVAVFSFSDLIQFMLGSK